MKFPIDFEHWSNPNLIGANYIYRRKGKAPLQIFSLPDSDVYELFDLQCMTEPVKMSIAEINVYITKEAIRYLIEQSQLRLN